MRTGKDIGFGNQPEIPPDVQRFLAGTYRWEILVSGTVNKQMVLVFRGFSGADP